MKRITDKERLDWIKAQGSKISLRGDGWVFMPRLISGQTTIRKAIDAAMKSDSSRKRGEE